jgi:hypothetical protein
MIEWLEGKRTDTNDDYNLPDDDLRTISAIIKTLQDHEGLKSMNEGLLGFMEDISSRLKKQSGK